MRKPNLTAFDEWVARTIDGLLSSLDLPEAKTVAIEPAPPKVPEPSETRKAVVCGIYVLIDSGVVMYVGQSVSVYARLAQHMRGAPFDFTDFFVIECEQKQLRELEAKYIHEYQPRWNKDIPAYGGKKHEYRKYAAL